MPYHPSLDPAQWQDGVYNRREAHRDSARRQSALLSYYFLAFLPAGLVFFVFANRLPVSSWRSWLLILAGVLLLATLLYILSSEIALRIAAQFIREFYQPSEDVNPLRIVRHRLQGVIEWPPPCSYFEAAQLPYLLVKEGRLEAPAGKEWLVWMAQNLGGPLRLIVFDGNALYLERGKRFSRVVGPAKSAAVLEWFETVKEVVETCHQVMEGVVEDCWTKDGIKIGVGIRVECSLGDPTPCPENALYPFDAMAVKDAVERTAVRMPDGKTLSEMKGMELVWGQVTSVIPARIGRFKLDELLLPEREAGAILTAEAARQLFEALNQATTKFGYHVQDLQITHVDLPPAIAAQRQQNWQAERKSLATLQQAQAVSARIRAVEQARAEAQRDLILAIAEGLARDPTRRFVEPLLLTLTNTLTTSLANPLVRPLLTPETLQALEKLKSLLEEKAG